MVQVSASHHPLLPADPLAGPVSLRLQEPVKKAVPPFPPDQSETDPPPQGIQPDSIKLFTAQEISGGPAQPREKEKPTEKSGWKVKSMDIGYGLMRNSYSKSDIRIQQPGNNTDVTLHDVIAEDRTSYHYIIPPFSSGFRPDEPQNNVKVSLQFMNDWGLEANLKHNKYTVQRFEQNVHFQGTLHGEPIDETRPLNTFAQRYEITNGLNQVSLMATRSFELASPWNTSLSFNTKLGPSAYLNYTKSAFTNPQGESEGKEGPFYLGGVGGVWENSLKYDFGPKLGHVFIELAHSLSYANILHSTIANGKASHSLWANQTSITVGKSFDFSKKKD